MNEIVEINRRRVFTRDEAEFLLPLISRMTDESSRQARRLMQCLDALPDKKSERARELESTVDAIVERWQKKISRLGGVPKGLWLADFDNGQGYWCWKYPETVIRYHHGYQDGFSGRKLIESLPGESQ